MPQLRQVVPDQGILGFKNANAAILPAKRIVKFTATAESIDLATAVADKIAGISYGAIPIGLYGDIQKDGIGILTSGAAVNVGDRITTDAAGKGVAAAPAGGTNNGLVGVALTATTATDQDFEIALVGQGVTFQG